MKTNIDELMKNENFTAFFVTGACMHNPFMVYLAGGIHHVSHAVLLKKTGQTAVMIHNDMERDEAAQTGFDLQGYNSHYHFRDLLLETHNDELKATVLLYEKIFKELGVICGKVAVFGEIDLGRGLAIFNDLQNRLPEVQFVGMGRDNFLTEAMQTKDELEIGHIRKMAEITTRVVGNTADFLTGHLVKDGKLVRKNGTYLTIGDVRKKINLWLAENDAENPEGTIFAIGRDAGVPHSMGTDGDVIETGKTIVFDIYPCQAGGGYFYDFTRTWSLGYATDAVLKSYEEVKTIYDLLIGELRMNNPLFLYQEMTCAYFESKGHATPRTHPATQDGYVHSLSHGVGLHVHEKPFTGISMEEGDCLLPNTIFTVEPGLYYPEKGFGIRIEDTYWTRPDGRFERLADFPYDLILPV
jgi:Xaa-Pro aminopeptidase